ncbi:HelD family protein [Vagococcus vulneris]|uniref:ATP-dependent DNA helicase IV n=1 Tax=Vagococcus vulneris TaxID=1977869 RepID=A0A429ZYA1_9ENTE|nr:UvrD-helicase domain-containing protein [Vagococcus vulneris]RST98932.1 ATP-dependent DNA helicase IV [Vagococcus vulneris]
MSQTEHQVEAAYLQDVYRQLVVRKRQLETLLERVRTEGISDIQTMMGDVRLNFSNISDNLDTFAALEMKNREIDQLNIKIKSAEEFLSKVDRLLAKPYFGKIIVDFLDDEQPEPFYIGINGFANDAGDYLIYDWRSPIAELFYNNEMGHSSYVVNKHQINVSIEQRRQFIVEAEKLINYFDTSVSIQDDVLLEVLGSDATTQMRDITSTIQKEQNVIIRDTEHANILVNGVAGSGKTSTIMQRIAYLLFQYKEYITSDNIMILSPNNKFIDYISDVLPSLGEKNPMNVTMLQFVKQYFPMQLVDETTHFYRVSAPTVSKTEAVLRDKKFSDMIKQAGYLFTDDTALFQSLKRKDKTIISKDRIASIFQSTPSDSALIDRIQATKQLLVSDWNRRIAKQARSNKVQDQVLTLSEEMQEKVFGSVLSENAEKNVYPYAKKILQKQYRSITTGIKQNDWLDLEYMFQKIYQTYSGETYEWSSDEVYHVDETVAFLTMQHHLVEALEVPKMRFILIDEIQDYTPAQISLLLDLFPKAKFTMVGDENQAIFNAHIPFSAIDADFDSRGLRCQRYNLLSSYRSTASITAFFGQLAAAEQKMSIVPIREEGELPTFYSYQSEIDFCQLVQHISKQLLGSALTIVTKNAAETAIVNNWLSELSALNVTVMPITLCKGLEFDNVLIYNASNINYETTSDQRLLYTIASRAMKRLYISYQDKLTTIIHQ